MQALAENLTDELPDITAKRDTANRRFTVGLYILALRYKPEGRGFDSRWSHWNFSVT
jgi:hypothetical protein